MGKRLTIEECVKKLEEDKDWQEFMADPRMDDRYPDGIPYWEKWPPGTEERLLRAEKEFTERRMKEILKRWLTNLGFY